MLTIGFANKYYTLWDCIVNESINDRGVKTIHHNNTYLKNISYDRAKAQAQYPDAKIDEGLRGHTRSFEYEHVIYPDDVFKFGRYTGLKFSEVHDTDYEAWYYGQTQAPALVPVLEQHGYVIVDGRALTNEEYNEKMSWIEQHERTLANIKNGLGDDTAEVHIEHNPDSEGYYYDESTGLRFKFSEVTERTYRGYEYYLPVQDGAAKRVKNKTILISGEEVGDIIHIHKFSIKK